MMIVEVYIQKPIIEVLSEDAGLPQRLSFLDISSKIIMSTILPSQNHKLYSGKKGYELIKASGSSQQEIAIEMARIVSSVKKNGRDSFYASLSRFINGKFCFSGWLLKRKDYCLFEALGLDSTRIFGIFYGGDWRADPRKGD